MPISKTYLASVMPNALGRIDRWIEPLVKEMTAHHITNQKRIAAFLANVAYETGELKAQVENLNYTPNRLMEVFPRIAPTLAQKLCAAGPEAIANYVYDDAQRSDRYKLGNTKPGDGWKYRGRGPHQLTGGDNYRAFFRSLGMPEDSDPDLLLTPELGAKAACFFWLIKGMNELADKNDFEEIVRVWTGGSPGLNDRRAYYYRGLNTPLGEPHKLPEAPKPVPPPSESAKKEQRSLWDRIRDFVDEVRNRLD